MKKKRFLGGVFLAAMLLLWGEGATGQTFTEVTSSNYSDLGVVSGAAGAWVLDCTMIEADRLATSSITDSDDLYSHYATSDTNRVYPKLLISFGCSITATWSDMTTSTSSSYIGNYTGYGYDDGWRLPTQRELMLILIAFTTTLNQLEDSIDSVDTERYDIMKQDYDTFRSMNDNGEYFWSATLATSSLAYFLYFDTAIGNAITTSSYKYYTLPVRELEY